MPSVISHMKTEQEKIIDEFAQFDDWSDRYEYLIDLGKALPPLDGIYKTDAHLVKGCQSRVWLHAELKDGRMHIYADSDTVITKGIIALLIRVLSGKTPSEVLESDMSFLDTIGLRGHLSPTRSNGLTSMIRHITSYAEHLIPVAPDPPAMSLSEKKEAMVQKIKEVYDPEIPVDIWELGLIYSLDIDETGKVLITMTLTSPACPVAGSLPIEVQERLLELPFVTDVELKLVWDPAWNKDRMSDEARMALDMF